MAPREDIDLVQGTTLEAWVIKMIQEKRTEEESFQAALRVWGRERLKKIWQEHQQKKKGK